MTFVFEIQFSDMCMMLWKESSFRVKESKFRWKKLFVIWIDILPFPSSRITDVEEEKVDKSQAAVSKVTLALEGFGRWGLIGALFW